MRTHRNKLPKIKPSFAFVVDGECECWYIQMLKRNEKSIRVDLKPELPQKKKLSQQYDRVRELSQNGTYEKIFWIVDLDTILLESKNAPKGNRTALQEFEIYHTDLSQDPRVVVILNNPCLEFWHLLHFEHTTRFYCSYDTLKSQLQKYLPRYEKTRTYYTRPNQDIYLQLKPYLRHAIAHAQKIKKFDFSNPSSGVSQMHLFFETEGIQEIL